MIKILTEGSSKYGFGHMVRCLTIADYCKEHKIEYDLIVDGDESSDDFIKENSGTNINWKDIDYLTAKLGGEDIVIIDSYYISLEQLERVKKISKKVVIIDDLSRLPYDDVIILNPNFCAELVKYNPNNDLLIGQDYCLLRKEFIDKKFTNKNEKVKNVLVTFGGSDILNLTPKIIGYFNVYYPEIKLDIVIGAGYSNMIEINAMTYLSNNMTLHHQVDANKMVELMLSNDFVISAAGQTLNELLKLGCPSCFIKVIDNQQLNIDYLNISKNGVILNENDFFEIDHMFDASFRNDLIAKLALIPNQTTGAQKLFEYLKQKELI